MAEHAKQGHDRRNASARESGVHLEMILHTEYFAMRKIRVMKKDKKCLLSYFGSLTFVSWRRVQYFFNIFSRPAYTYIFIYYVCESKAHFAQICATTFIYLNLYFRKIIAKYGNGS